MKRKIKDYVIITLKGMAMGAADVVPGVSGGTIAFISGIYEELLQTISNVNLKLIKTLRKNGFKAAWNQANGNFIAALFLGIFISVVSLAKGLKWMLENEPIALWSFFFGLVLASVIYVGKQIKKWNVGSIIFLIIGAVLAYYITTLNPMGSQNSSPWFMFLAGALAICAMILPGISGAFILVLLGAYESVLEAVNTRNILTIAFIGAGTIVGLLSFSRILKWLFAKYKDFTLAILTGFIVGSLNKIWPWKETLTYRLNSQGVEVPLKQISISPNSYEGEPQLLMALGLSIVGFAVIIILEKLAVKKY